MGQFHAFPNIPITKALLRRSTRFALLHLKMSDNPGFRNILSDRKGRRRWIGSGDLIVAKSYFTA
jgi:hypothetical protein